MTVSELFQRSSNAELSEQLAFDVMRGMLRAEEAQKVAMGAAVDDGLKAMWEMLCRGAL